jgi:hypothetical protein
MDNSCGCTKVHARDCQVRLGMELSTGDKGVYTLVKQRHWSWVREGMLDAGVLEIVYTLVDE